jgi:DNA-binding NarL/FixJ family response regulator
MPIRGYGKYGLNNSGFPRIVIRQNGLHLDQCREAVMEPGSKVRVLLVDDNFMVRQTMRDILQSHSDIEVVGEASDGDEAVAYVGMLQPVLVVMDMNLRRMDGIRATRSIKTEYPHVLVLGYSADPKDYNVSAMKQVGAFEVLQKDDAIKDLYGAIQRGVASSK